MGGGKAPEEYKKRMRPIENKHLDEFKEEKKDGKDKKTNWRRE